MVDKFRDRSKRKKASLRLDHKLGYAELSSKAIKGSALPLQGIHHIHGSHSLPLGMLSVGHGITDDILQENLENTPGFLIDETTDPFDTTPSCKSPDCRLGDALDVVPQNFAMPLGS